MDPAKKLAPRVLIACLLPLLSGCAGFLPFALTTGASFALPQYASLALTGAKVLHKSALIAADERRGKEMFTDKFAGMKAQALLFAERAGGVDAFCFNNDLYLVGEVENAAERERILSRVRELPVREIKGLLKERATYSPLAGLSDAALERKIQAVLLKKLLLKSANIDVRVVQREVVLVGVVRDKAEEAEIVRHIQSLDGLADVPVTSILAFQEEFEKNLPASNARFALLDGPGRAAPAAPLPGSPLAPDPEFRRTVVAEAHGAVVGDVRGLVVSEIRAPVRPDAARPQWNKARLKVNERLLGLARGAEDSRVREDLARLAQEVLTDTDFSIRDRLSAAAGVAEHEPTARKIQTLLSGVS